MSGIQYGHPAPHKLTAETVPGGPLWAVGDWCPGMRKDYS